MRHATPDDAVLEHWHSAIAMLQSRAGVDYCVMRQIQGRGSDVICCYPSPVPSSLIDGQGQTLEGRFAHRVLESGAPLAVPDADDDAHWDAMCERRGGFRAYWGEPLLWPDREPFGCVELLSHDLLEAEAAAAVPSLLSCVATGIRAQLEVLYLRRDTVEAPLHDSLTGLAGPRLFREFTVKQIQQADRNGGELWMLQWSLDEFPTVQQNLSDGDCQTLIRGCAEGANSCVRRSDILARLDENQFAMLLGEANEFAATAVADRIRRKLRQLPVPGGATLTISCGLSPYAPGEDARRWETRNASAVDEARIAGGDRTVVLTQGT